MAMEGQLSDFNLAEILQLLATQQKSGFLTLQAKRELVFIFDKGILVSTRDRRSRSRDPLEAYLMAYGFFSEDEWRHVEYVRKNSKLDLTEILVSEGLLDGDEMNRVLMGVAQEMTHAGMKMNRGQYHFTPTRECPPGVKWKINFDVQGLLMEAARRLDEDNVLKEYLPSQALTFSQGTKALPPGDLGPLGRRVMELALAGTPLGRIIRQGRCESFVTRNLLKTWCEEGILKKVEPKPDQQGEKSPRTSGRRSWLKTGLRSTKLTVGMVLLLGCLAWGRYAMLEPTDTGFGRDLRLRQIRAEVIDAARLFRYQRGDWPDSLAELVRNGQLSPSTLAVVHNLGWTYHLNRDGDQFTLG